MAMDRSEVVGNVCALLGVITLQVLARREQVRRELAMVRLICDGAYARYESQKEFFDMFSERQRRRMARHWPTC